MKTKNPFTDIAALEKELAEIAPRVREGFSQAGGPSARVEAAIREEARRQAGRRPSLIAWPFYRTLAAAASLTLLLGGAVQLHVVHQASQNARAVHHILNIGATQASIDRERPADGAAALASRLLDIQGLDEEGFFKAEEEESLSL